MKIGVQLPEIEYEASWKQVAAMARLAEEVGLDSIWLGDHLLYDLPEGRRGPWEAWSMLAALAAVTERVELGPLVAALPFHNPAMLAKKAATVDEISGGRLILGVGAGWNQVEFEAFGLPYDRRIARFAEAFTIVRTLLSEGRIDFRGEFYTLVDCELLPRPSRPGGPPLLIGSNGPRMLALTLPYVSAWNSWYTGFRQRPRPVGSAGRDDRCRAAAEAGRLPGRGRQDGGGLHRFRRHTRPAHRRQSIGRHGDDIVANLAVQSRPPASAMSRRSSIRSFRNRSRSLVR